MEIVKYNGYGNVIYFDNDDDFYKFSVEPILIQKMTDTGIDYFDFNFSPGYSDALDNCKCFIIKDKNSNIYKHKCVSYKTISKPINNLKNIQYDNILKKKYPEYMVCDTYYNEYYND